MKHLVPVLILFAMASIAMASAARAACDLSSINGHQNNQWSVEFNVKDGTFSQTLDTDKSQKKSGAATISCDSDRVTIRQTSATAGRLCSYDLKRSGSSVSGTYTCPDRIGVQTFSGIAK